MKKLISTILAMVMAFCLVTIVSNTAEAANMYNRNNTNEFLFRSDGRRSNFFTVGMVRCHGSTNCSVTYFPFDSRLVDLLDLIRNHYGRDVVINQPGFARGFRCEGHARAWGLWLSGCGHLNGTAVDISINGVGNQDILNFARNNGANNISYVGSGFVHIQINASGIVVQPFVTRADDIGTNFYAMIVGTTGALTFGNWQTETRNINQIMRFNREPDGSYLITNMGNNQLLDLANAATANGTFIGTHPHNGGAAQRWRIERNNANNRYTIGSVADPLRVIDGNPNQPADNRRAISWERNNTPAQWFEIRRINYITRADDIGTDFYAMIVGTTGVLTFGHWRPYAGSREQIVRFTRQADGSYTITNIANNQLLDLANAANANGTLIGTHPSNGNSAQRWRIERDGDRYMIGSAAAPLRVVDGNPNASADNRRAISWGRNNTPAQWFEIRRIDDVNAYLNLSLSTTTTVTRSGQNYIFNIGITNPTNGILIVSTFDGFGRMVEAKTEPITGTTINVPITMSNTLGAANAKVMIWDGFNNMRPLIAELEIISSLP